MRFKVLKDNRFGEGWQAGDIIEMDWPAAEVRVEQGDLKLLPDAGDNTNINILKDTKSVLDSLEVPFLLACGTCLGYVREKDFIAHDKDIDISVMSEYEDKVELIIEKMEDRGFDTHIFGNRGYGFELSFKRDEGKIDIFFLYKKDDKLWHAVYRHGELIPYVFDAKLLTRTRKVNFKGLEVKVPFNTTKYIQCVYGEDWETVKKEWNYWEHPKCIDKSLL